MSLLNRATSFPLLCPEICTCKPDKNGLVDETRGRIAPKLSYDPSHRLIEVRSFKWPHRATSIAHAYLLGEDVYGRWLGIAQGSLWSSADGSRSGIFTHSFVKLVPEDTWWTACFQDRDPVVDVDIVASVKWMDDSLEEIDLELDILQYADGSVSIRDQDKFHDVCEQWNVPKAIVAQAEQACEQVFTRLKERQEPFRSIGHNWLSLHLFSRST